MTVMKVCTLPLLEIKIRFGARITVFIECANYERAALSFIPRCGFDISCELLYSVHSRVPGLEVFTSGLDRKRNDLVKWTEQLADVSMVFHCGFDALELHVCHCRPAFSSLRHRAQRCHPPEHDFMNALRSLQFVCLFRV